MITRSALIEVLESKYEDIKICRLRDDIGNDLSNVSAFRALVRDYLSLVLNLSQVSLLESSIKWIDRKYPYIAFLQDFIEKTDWNGGYGKQFDSFSGFIFVTALMEKIKIPAIDNLLDFCNETKRNVKYLHTQVIHILKTIGSEDLSIFRKKPDNMANVDDKIFVNIKDRRIIYKGVKIVRLTDNKFPIFIFQQTINHNRRILPLSEVKTYTAQDINEYIKNFNKTLKGKLRKHNPPAKLFDQQFLSKPSNEIIVSDVFQGI